MSISITTQINLLTEMKTPAQNKTTFTINMNYHCTIYFNAINIMVTVTLTVKVKVKVLSCVESSLYPLIHKLLT